MPGECALCWCSSRVAWQWINTRRLLSWPRWRTAWSAIRAWTGSAPGGAKGDSAFAHEVAKRGWSGFEIVASHQMAEGWRELGPTSSLHELVVADPRCMHQRTEDSQARQPHASGCVPIPTRGGWNASIFCSCVDGYVLNCAAPQPQLETTRAHTHAWR